MADVKAIRERLNGVKKYVPISWRQSGNTVMTTSTDVDGYATEICRLTPCNAMPYYASFIANAPADIVALLEEVERLREEVQVIANAKKGIIGQ
jgi:hypothetical protein